MSSGKQSLNGTSSRKRDRHQCGQPSRNLLAGHPCPFPLNFLPQGPQHLAASGLVPQSTDCTLGAYDLPAPATRSPERLFEVRNHPEWWLGGRRCMFPIPTLGTPEQAPAAGDRDVSLDNAGTRPCRSALRAAPHSRLERRLRVDTRRPQKHPSNEPPQVLEGCAFFLNDRRVVPVIDTHPSHRIPLRPDCNSRELGAHGWAELEDKAPPVRVRFITLHAGQGILRRLLHLGATAAGQALQERGKGRVQ